jgi:16S rRNA (guanine527-N7)-methyltransferase
MSDSRLGGSSSRSPRSEPAVTGSAEAGEAVSGGEFAVEARLGAAVGKLRSYAALLGTDGVLRGVIGPREVPRLWDRHILNSAALLPLLPNEGVVVDVGSGAGLPGVVLGIIRPTLAVTLLEPLLRRVQFLTECVEALDLSNLTVLRGRAEEHAGLDADVAVARAVAPLAHLTKICLPLLRPAGELLALKGEKAEQEVHMAEETLRSLGATSWSVVTVAPPHAAATATVIRVVAGSSRDQGQRRSRRRQKQPDLGRGDGGGDARRAHGGG